MNPTILHSLLSIFISLAANFYNRVGKYNAYGIISHDDYYQLLRELREILAYLAAGSNGADFYEVVNRVMRERPERGDDA